MLALKLRRGNLRRTLLCAAVSACFSSPSALANPTGAAVVSGSATFATVGRTLTVTNTPSAILNWQGFSIAVGETTRFQQQSAASAVMNRVVGQDPSAILGTLSSNGRVFLLNPNGIVFGVGSRVDVAGLVATTLNLSNQDFLAGRLNFDAGAVANTIVNHGSIVTPSGGRVYLIAPNVENHGVIQTPQGQTILAAGRSVQLVEADVPDLRVEVQAGGEAMNVGQIIANGGSAGIYAGLINQQGLVRANSVSRDASGRIVFRSSNVLINTGSIQADGTQGGSVAIETRNFLSAGRISADGSEGAGGEVNVQASGRILQTSAAHLSADGATGGGKVTLQAADRVFGSGTLTAIGQGAGSTGGEIRVLANDIVLLGARLDASGDAGGGTVLVGGDFQGGAPAVQNAATNWINFSTTLNADARTTGDGGKVIVWSDQETQFYGSISARGGAASGDGGFIEVSGKENLVFGGMADASAPNGKPGTLLLDPKFIIIDSAGGGGLSSFLLVDPNPGASDGFAQHIVVLPNDNVVATDPNDSLVALAAGAVYLFNGTTGALISTLTGSTALDQVGFPGITALTGNNNFVVRSPSWNGSRGAVTWGNGATGVSGVVSGTNSLVGTTANDQVGNGGVTALTNGNYVVSSWRWDNGGVVDAGAASWVNGTNGNIAGSASPGGAVSATNSLVGTTAGETVGFSGITALSNGNYVVASSGWDNVGAVNAGAVTWGDGSTAGTRLVGTISDTNSLVGTTASDGVGSGGVTALLTNGNYVVISPDWGNAGVVSAGAVTFGSGTSGISGAVSASNSLVGTTANDFVGNSGVTALTNGNYVVRSSFWYNGATRAGAVTFGSGTTGISGVVTDTNSLVGTTSFDLVGSNGVTALTNGNYVVRSPNWDGATADVGAVTWGNGAGGTVGAVSAANSLVGTTAFDLVGNSGVTALTNGNYVVRSPNWDDAAANVGAVTWGNGLGGTVGPVSAANSLVGSTLNDQVGSGGVTALTNGNYVVRTSGWDNGAATGAGAVTWGNGLGGTIGPVTPVNSLVGTTTSDSLGNSGITALTNGNYVVASPDWNNGAAFDAGAATFGSGTTGVSGVVSAANSLVGTTADDQVSRFGVTALSNGNYVVLTIDWRNGAAARAGAVTFGSGTTGVSGAVSALNSLVGTTANDFVGCASTCSNGITVLTNGNYVVSSSSWRNGAVTVAGAVTFSNGTTGVSGAVSAANSLVGTTANDQLGSGGVTPLSNGNVVVRSPLANNGAIVDAGLVHVFSPGGGGGFTNPLGFADNAAGTTTITPAAITAITNTGSAVVLQANNDITLATASPITTVAGGLGGAITLQAGRSVILNSNITTDNGTVTIVANETTANGVVDVNRDPGAAMIAMATGSTINAGSGNISITLNPGTGLTNNASGDITLANLTTTGHVLVQNLGPTAGSGIVRADATQLVTAASAAFDVNGAGLGGKIGTLAAPIRLTVSNLEARSQAGGAFFDSPAQGLTIGGAALGGLFGLIASSTGAIGVAAPASIAVIEAVNASGGGVTLAASGALSNLSITGSGGVNTNSGVITLIAGQDIIHSGGASQINTSSGAMNLTAGRDILHTGPTSQINTFTGAMTLMAGRDIIHTDANQINSSSGPMLLSAGRDIVHSGTAGQINNNTGNLTITAGQDFIHGAGAGQVNTSSGALNINVGRDFTHSASGPINTSSGMLNINVGRDFLYSGSGQVNASFSALTVAVTNSLTMSGASSRFNGGSGGQTITVGQDLTLANGADIRNFSGGAQSVTVGNDLTLAGTGSGPTEIVTNGNQSLAVGRNLVLTGNTYSAEISGGGPGRTQTISTGGDILLTGGSVGGAYARIFGNPDVGSAATPVSVGGVIRMTAGSGAGAFARIESFSPTSIYIHFPNLTGGGYFVNGIEGVVYDPGTSSGFVAGGVPAILAGNLIVTYRIAAAAAAAGTPIFLTGLVNQANEGLILPGDEEGAQAILVSLGGAGENKKDEQPIYSCR